MKVNTSQTKVIVLIYCYVVRHDRFVSLHVKPATCVNNPHSDLWEELFFTSLITTKDTTTTLLNKFLTRWVSYDGYIHHQNDHLSGRMTDISVMGEWQVAGVGRGFGHSRMFWARLSRDDFRSKLKIISFLSRVMSVSKNSFVSRAFERFGAKLSSSGAFGFDDVLEVFLKTPLRHRAFFANSDYIDYDPSIFLKISFLFSKTEPMLLAWPLWRSPSWAKHFGDGTSKTRMKIWLPCVGEIERRRTMDRRRDWHESCAMIHAPKEKITQGSQRVILRRLKPSSSSNQRVLRSQNSPVSETRCRYRFALCCFRGRGCTAAGRSGCSAGKAKKSSHPWHFGVDHWGVMNLSAPISFAGQGRCTVFCHVMQLSFSVLCWKSALAVILPEIKEKKSLSNVGHRAGYQSWKLGLALNGLKAILNDCTCRMTGNCGYLMIILCFQEHSFSEWVRYFFHFTQKAKSVNMTNRWLHCPLSATCWMSICYHIMWCV